jgi:WD40 repeat protein
MYQKNFNLNLFLKHTNVNYFVSYIVSGLHNKQVPGLKSIFLCGSSSDKSIIVWDLELGKSLHILRGHDSDVVALCVSMAAGAAAGRSYQGGNTAPLIISASWDGMLRAWAPETGDCLRTVRAHPSEGISRFGPSVACLAAAGSGIVGGFVGGLLRIFDVWTGLAQAYELRWPTCGCAQVF